MSEANIYSENAVRRDTPNIGDLGIVLSFLSAVLIYAEPSELKYIANILMYAVFCYGCARGNILKIEWSVILLFTIFSLLSEIFYIDLIPNTQWVNYRVVMTGLLAMIFFRKYKAHSLTIKLIMLITIASILIESVIDVKLQLFAPKNEYYASTARVLGIFNDYHLTSYILALGSIYLFKKISVLQIAFLGLLIYMKVLTVFVAYTVHFVYSLLGRKMRIIFGFFIGSASLASVLFIDEIIALADSYDFYKVGGIVAYKSMIYDNKWGLGLQYLFPLDLDYFNSMHYQNSPDAWTRVDIGYYAHLVQMGILAFILVAIYIKQQYRRTLPFLAITLIHNSYILLPLAIAFLFAIERRDERSDL